MTIALHFRVEIVPREKMAILGLPDPPKTLLGPSDPPRRDQKFLKYTCPRLALLISDKKDFQRGQHFDLFFHME